MKTLKLALLGGAALAVSASGAFADELSDLKAQLEALKSRVGQLEAAPPPAALPEGYSFMSVRKGSFVTAPVAMRKDDRIEQGDGFTISVLPSADAAPTTEVTVNGEIRTQIFYTDSDTDTCSRSDGDIGEPVAGTRTCVSFGDDAFDVRARVRLAVTGKTDTAVGEVGAFIRFNAGADKDFDVTSELNQGYGWWQMAETWKLLAGFTDNTAAIQAGVDWDFTFGTPEGGISNNTVDQMRLVYTGGPIEFAVAVEDNELSDKADIPAFAGYAIYNNDNIFLQVAGAIQDDETTGFGGAAGFAPAAFNGDTDWFVGAGARIGLGDMFTFTAAAGFGEGYGSSSFRNSVTAFATSDDEYWGASAGVIIALSDDLTAEVGGAYAEGDSNFASFDTEEWGVTAGLYWKPVDQLKLGWQAQYSDVDTDFIDGDGDAITIDTEAITARFVTWMSF